MSPRSERRRPPASSPAIVRAQLAAIDALEPHARIGAAKRLLGGQLDALDQHTKGVGTGRPIPGICNRCGCTETHACAGGCAWANPQKTLCSRCAP